MKKKLSVLVLTMFIILLTGCSKNIDLTVDNVDKDTLVIREDGTLQAAMVDTFDKDYYDFEEFSEFVNKEMNDYNGLEGENSITLDGIEEKDDKVVVIMSYNNMDSYSAFNHIEASLTDGGTARGQDTSLPESFLDTKGQTVSLEDALKEDEYKVLSINEYTKLMVEGKILYYHNGNYIDSQTIETDEEEVTFIIYENK